MSKPWTKRDALLLCKEVEELCLDGCGCHVALTGGCLYKDGERKDLDLIFYRVRQVDVIDIKSLFHKLKQFGFELLWGGAWVYKFNYKGRRIDCFFPEEHRVNDYRKPDGKFQDPDLEETDEAESYP